MKFAVCNDVYEDESIFQIIEHAARIGYDGIELAPFTLTQDVPAFPPGEQRRIAACARDNGIELMGLHWLLTRPEGLHITTPDAAVRTRTLDFFRKLIEIAVNTGATVLTLGSPGQRSYPDGTTHEQAVDRLVDFFRTLLPELEQAGLRVGLEPLEPEVTNFMYRTGETCEIVDRLAAPAIGMTMDTHFIRWECETHGGTVRDVFDRVGPRLVHVHIQDDNNDAPGTGNADFTGLAAELDRIEWDGYVCMETFPHPGKLPGPRCAEAGIRFMKHVLGQEERSRR